MLMSYVVKMIISVFIQLFLNYRNLQRVIMIKSAF